MSFDFLIYTLPHSMEGMPIALKLQDEGYRVAMAIMEPREADPHHFGKQRRLSEAEIKRKKLYPLVGEGLIEKVSADEIKPEPETIIIFDFNYGYSYAEKLLKTNRGLFSFEWAYRMELDRAISADFVRKYYPQLALPEEIDFPKGSANRIMSFLEYSDGFWVVKPNTDEIHVFVPDTNDREVYLDAAQQYLIGDKKTIDAVEVQLQKKIFGFECCVETWYRDGEPVLSNVDIELKNMFAGNLLPQTGCAANLLFNIPLNCELRRITNAPFDIVAKKLGFTGLMDAAVIFEETTGQPYFLEFCPGRFGYNAIFSLLDRMKGRVGEFFIQMVTGKELPVLDSLFGASVRIFDYTHYYYLGSEQKRLLSIPNAYGIWLWDVMKQEDKLYVVGANINTMVVTASSHSPLEALRAAKQLAHRVRFDTRYFRWDIDETESRYSMLNRYNYLRHSGLLGARQRTIGRLFSAAGEKELIEIVR